MYFKYSLLTAFFLAEGVSGTAAPTISTKPSSMPSSHPSSYPSSDPSSHPSSHPSSDPSSHPSSMPSSHPSSHPSSQPSSVPSSQPSESPSSRPSSMPSESPSSQPSESPSSRPSSMPSERPSSQPSSQPSSMPSCTPSQAPTPSPSINLFYPDWSADGSEQGCLNDGNQPAYMESNTAYMHSTLDKCCSTHFAWNYEGCMGMLDDTCVRALWYPDWEGENTGCVRDGNEPLYMTQNNAVYLFSTKSDCCEEHYSWNLAECMGSSASTSGGKYYPDWLGDDTCKNNGAAPSYMVQNPTMWLHDSLAACCAKNYSWKLAECKNGGSAPAPAPSGLFYPDWQGTNEGCLNDGNEPEYMVNNPSQWMYSTLDACCKKHYTYDLAGCTGAAASGGTSKFYMDWVANKCVQDCEGAAPCGGVAGSWDTKYDTKTECCNEKMSWDKKTCNA